jgi:hypothetical protein
LRPLSACTSENRYRRHDEGGALRLTPPRASPPNYGQLVAFEPAERIAGRSLAITRVDGARPVKLITHLMEDHMPTAHLGGSLELADHFTLSRMGYGAMQLAGPGVWGPPRNRGEAITVLREAAEGSPQPKGQNHPLLAAPPQLPPRDGPWLLPRRCS